MSLESEVGDIITNATADRTSDELEGDLRTLDGLAARARQVTDLGEKDRLVGKINHARGLIFDLMPAARRRNELDRQMNELGFGVEPASPVFPEPPDLDNTRIPKRPDEGRDEPEFEPRGLGF